MFFYFCTIVFFFTFFTFFACFAFLYFCTFVLCHLIRRSIWTSMRNLESVPQKMAELWVLLYFLYFCNLFVNGCGRSRSTSKRNFGLVAQKVMLNFVYLAAILFFWWPFCFSYFGCEWSRSTSMRKFGLLAQKMSDLATILFFFPNLWPLRKVTSLDKKVTSLDPNLWPLERSNPGVYLNIQPPIKNRQKYTDFETLGRRNMDIYPRQQKYRFEEALIHVYIYFRGQIPPIFPI